MGSNVVPFTGKTTLDIDPDGVLEGAKGELEQVLVLGFDEDGEYYFASSTSNIGTLLRLIETFKFDLLSGEFGYRLED